MDDFESFVRTNSRPIYGFIFRLCGDKEAAQDLAQDVFLKAWKNRSKINKEKNPRAWLFMVARNATIDWLRRQKGVPFSKLSGDGPEDISFEEGLEDTEPLSDSLFENKAAVQKLERALNSISIEERSILLMHDSDDLTFDEIGRAIKRPLNTVKSRYRRAIRKLRELMSE